MAKMGTNWLVDKWCCFVFFFYFYFDTSNRSTPERTAVEKKTQSDEEQEMYLQEKLRELTSELEKKERECTELRQHIASLEERFREFK